MRAAWSVPRMTSGFGEAHASTWIGAQALRVPARSPFIQAGTTEDRGTASRPVYAAFWTDTKRGYHPQVLFHVRPGDEVTTSLTLVAGRWQVVIADATSGRRAVFLTREEGEAAFNLAEWLQEDPSETSGRATPYPALSQVRISHLAANGAQPRYADMYAQWMSVGGATLAPTPVRDGAFSITRGVISPAGRRYLQIARPQNIAARRVDIEEASWTGATLSRRIRSVSAAAAASERAYAHGLAQAHWPAAAQAVVDSLVRQVRVEARMFASAARRAPDSLTAWQRRLARLTPGLLRLAHRVRRALHLPELVSGQLPGSAQRAP
ncbi:MAG: G1 family glutamic endopeptidase [Solirubrobacteraceae bacterium]